MPAVRRQKAESTRGQRTGAGTRIHAEALRLLELMPGLVCAFDTDLRYTYSNDAYARLRGFKPEAVIGLHFRDVVGPVNFAAIRHHLEKALSGQSTDFEYDVVIPGQKRRVLAHYRPDCGPEGRVQGVLCALIDLSAVTERQQLAVETEQLLENTFVNAPIGMAVSNTLGRILRVNESFATMLGYTPSTLKGMGIGDITHPDDLESGLEVFRSALRGETNGYNLDKRYIHRHGSVVEAVLSVSTMRNAAGEIVYFVSHALDVTEQRKAARAMEATNAQLSLAMEVLRGGFWHLDIATRRFETSRQLGSFIQGPEADALDMTEYVSHIPGEDLAGADFSELINGSKDRAVAQYRLETVNGVRWMRCDRQLIRDTAGRPASIVGVAVDITEEHELLCHSRVQADTDSLTGLINRRGLQSRMDAGFGGRHWTALAIDLDGFKMVNDIHGHAAGDHVLVETARRMLSHVRENEIVVRLGGDEFVIILPGVDRAGVSAVADRLVTSVQQPIEFGGQTLKVSCSIGVAVMDGGQIDLTAALKSADAALYQAKASGKNTWRIN